MVALCVTSEPHRSAVGRWSVAWICRRDGCERNRQPWGREWRSGWDRAPVFHRRPSAWRNNFVDVINVIYSIILIYGRW
jgi:hypothetical protein